MSNAVRNIIDTKTQQKPTFTQIKGALKAHGVEAFVQSHSTDRMSRVLAPEYSPDFDNRQNKVDLELDKLVLLVGLQRGGEVDFSQEIERTVSLLSHTLCIDGKPIDENVVISLGCLWDREGIRRGAVTPDFNGKQNAAEQVMKDVISRVEAVYKELFSSAKDTAAALSA